MVKHRIRISVLLLFFVFLLSTYFTFQLAIENKWFESSVTVHTVLHEGDGLRKGTHVSLRGIRVGEISDLEITEDGTIKATLRIKKSYFKKLKRDAKAQVK